MALIKCPECGREVSDTIERCIGCGYELKRNSQQVKCPECGRDIIDTTRPCSYCGYEVIKSSQASYNSMEQAREYRPRHEAYDKYDDDEYIYEEIEYKKVRSATIGFVLGLCSIIAWIIPLFGFPVTICGIVFSSKGISSRKSGMAWVGLCLSIVFVVVTLINSISGAVMFSDMSSNKSSSKSSSSSSSSNYITLAKYNKIKTGMTYSEVREIIGSSGTLGAESDGSQVYSWTGKDYISNATICFINGKVYTKAQSGLK